jgi:protein SCO1/2
MGKVVLIRKSLWWFLALVFTGVAGTGVWIWQGRGTQLRGWEEKALEGLRVYGTVPDFSLVERGGQQVELTDLKGKIWVALFFYTRCRDICPLIVSQMGLLHLEFPDEKDLRLVSITVDPKRDTPEVLAEFAERFSANPQRWLFLTGKRETIYRLTQEGFHVGLGERERSSRENQKSHEENEILHSSRLILVDRKARIRGYYSGIEAEAMVRLRRDLRSLLSS